MNQLIKSSSGIETDIVLGTGDTGNQEQIKNWSSNIHWVREDIRNIKASFIKLGFHLYEIKRCNAYCIYGYDDFYEFCDNNFHLSSSTVRRHIQIYERFGEYRDGSIKMNIANEYEGYTYSQLCEMLPLKDEELENIKSEMTVKEIREYKAGLKSGNYATSHKTKRCEFNPYYECDIDCVMKKYFKKNGNIVGCVGCCSICLEKETCQYKCEYEAALKRLNSLEIESEGKLEEIVCDVAQTEPEQDESESENSVFIETSFLDDIIGFLDDVIRFINQENYDTASQMVLKLRNRFNSIIEDKYNGSDMR